MFAPVCPAGRRMEIEHHPDPLLSAPAHHPVHRGKSRAVLRLKEGRVQRHPQRVHAHLVQQVDVCPGKEAPVRASWVQLPGTVRHTFTHFHLELAVLAGETGADPKAQGIWVPLDRLSEQALPTVMKKVVNHALGIARRSRRGR